MSCLVEQLAIVHSKLDFTPIISIWIEIVLYFSIPLKIAEENHMENKLLIKSMQLIAKATRGLVVDISTSWYKAFEKEFSKEYFQKVLWPNFYLLQTIIIIIFRFI
jgi:hypothetical protein